MSELDVLKKFNTGYYLMNTNVLIGPFWEGSRLKRYKERNELSYGELKILFMDENKNVKYLCLEEVK
jgi:hypothetical protein